MIRAVLEKEMNYPPSDLEFCPDHPDAMVRHTYDADFYVMNGERVGTGINRRTVRYECAACCRELRRLPLPEHAEDRSNA